MKSKLYPNMKHMTTIFCVGIVAVTLTVLTLRLTLLSDMAFASDSKTSQVVEVIVQADENEEPLITCKINTQVKFDKPDAQGDFMIENPATNACYLSVDIFSEEIGRSVYFSGWLSPGARKSTARLSDPLEEGVYECTATIEAMAEMDGNRSVLAAATVPVTLHIGQQEASGEQDKEK